MKYHIIAFSLFLALSIGSLSAQNNDIPSAITVKWLGTDYLAPNVNDTDYSLDLFKTGLEVGYTKSLSDIFNLHIPLKIGEADLPTSSVLGGPSTKEGFLSLDALAQLSPVKGFATFKPYVFAGVAGHYTSDSEFFAAIPVGAGLNLKVANGVYLQVQGEYRVGLKDFRDHVQASAGFFIPLRGNKNKQEKAVTIIKKPILTDYIDTDKDGVEDAVDRCPNEAGLREMAGCPDYDKDGVADGDDNCPDVPGLRALNGCPDSDGDGIIDKEDDCPDAIGTLANKGCPTIDTDGDGVDDKDDICPNVKGFVRFKGCPDRDADGTPDNLDDCPDNVGPANLNGCPDSDGDGVLDKDDKCPGKVGLASNAGCPEVKVVKEEIRKVLEYAAQNVEFDTNSSRVRSASRAILREIATIMAQNPEYHLSMSGHTDSSGNDARNLKLSKERAAACMKYLISQGVSASRLSSEGYGETQPITDNTSSAGMRKNRRVEFNMFLP